MQHRPNEVIARAPTEFAPRNAERPSDRARKTAIKVMPVIGRARRGRNARKRGESGIIKAHRHNRTPSAAQATPG